MLRMNICSTCRAAFICLNATSPVSLHRNTHSHRTWDVVAYRQVFIATSFPHSPLLEQPLDCDVDPSGTCTHRLLAALHHCTHCLSNMFISSGCILWDCSPCSITSEDYYLLWKHWCQMDVGGAQAMNKHKIVHPTGCKLLLGLGGASCVGHPSQAPCFGWHSLEGFRVSHLRENACLRSRNTLGWVYCPK